MKTQVIEHEWTVADEAGTETNHIQAIRRPTWEWVAPGAPERTFNTEPFEVGESRSNAISINSVEEAHAYINLLYKVIAAYAEDARKEEAE
jgi:hypothetical protein